MERLLVRVSPYLDIPLIRRIRRNHGLEHATIHVMARQVPNLRIAGRSDGKGFWLWGDVSLEQVESSVTTALKQMQGGAHHLAIHPNCGTNLVTTASIGALGVLVALMGSENEQNGKYQRFPLLVVAIMGALIFGQPLGLKLQKHITTLGDPADLHIISIDRKLYGKMVAHRVETWSS